MKRLIGTVSLVVLLLLVLGTQSWSQNQPYSFGVIIWRSPTLTAQFWNPILRHVSERSGVPLQLKVANTGPAHTAMVGQGTLDFLYSNHNFIKENEASGYRVFARPREDAGTGEIVVLKDSPVRSLSDLEGRKWYSRTPRRSSATTFPWMPCSARGSRSRRTSPAPKRAR